MTKKIFITNGIARCGKDTFASFLNEIIPTTKYSSIDKIKEIAMLCGWNGEKNERSRKFLYELKKITTEYYDTAFNDIKAKVNDFKKDNINNVLLIDIREPKEIERAVNGFDAKTILIKNEKIRKITSNDADCNVFKYHYDYVIMNDETLEAFKEEVKCFAEKYILGDL